VSARLARLTAHGGPRGVYLTAEGAVSAAGPAGRLWLVRDELDIVRPVPRGEPAADYRYLAARSAHVPRVAVAMLPGARVDGRFGGIISDDGRLVYEFSQYFGISGPHDHPQFLRPFRKPPVDHDGTVAVLGDRGDDNYYHFLTDVLPKLALLADCPDLPAIDAYYVPSNRGFQKALLERAGVAMDRVIDSREVPYLRARQLVVPGLPDAHLQAPPWIVDWLRVTLLAGVPTGGSRRLYLTRGGRRSTRIAVNEPEVVAALEPLGFEVFDAGAHSVTEQIEAFANAEFIIAPHGASLANLVFATGPTRVVEMFPPDYVNTCYWALSHQLAGIEYRYVLGVGPVPPGDPQGVASDIVVDVARLLRVLGL
jgi:capsular polysaccharide biosynthesis protein